MNLKYRVKFEIENISKAELRNVKIDSLTSNYLLEFESDSFPTISNSTEKINICNELYVIHSVTHSYITENLQIYHLIVVSIESQKSIDEKERLKKEAKDLAKKQLLEDSRNRTFDINKYIREWDIDAYNKKYLDKDRWNLSTNF